MASNGRGGPAERDATRQAFNARRIAVKESWPVAGRPGRSRTKFLVASAINCLVRYSRLSDKRPRFGVGAPEPRPNLTARWRDRNAQGCGETTLDLIPVEALQKLASLREVERVLAFLDAIGTAEEEPDQEPEQAENPDYV